MADSVRRRWPEASRSTTDSALAIAATRSLAVVSRRVASSSVQRTERVVLQPTA